MRFAIAALCVITGLAWPQFATALYPGLGSSTLVDSYDVDPGKTAVVQLHCSPDRVFVGVHTRRDAAGVTRSIAFTTGSGAAADLASSVGVLGGGVTVTVTNASATAQFGVVIINCLPPTSGLVTALTAQIVVPGNGTAPITGSCPSPSAAVGFASSVDGVNVGQAYAVYKYGVPPSKYLDDLTDGLNTFPTGIEQATVNHTTTAKPVMLATYCANVPALQTIIYSVPTTPGNPFSIFAPVPDGYNYVGHTFVGGQFGTVNDHNLWGTNGIVTSEYAAGGVALTGNLTVKAALIEGVDSRPKSAIEPKSTARAVLGLLVIPSTAAIPAPTMDTVVEFYNAALDHYFITTIAKEISDLDQGVHPGWARTGASFKVYAVGSTGHAGRRPVCRAYGNPASGLDSHFYSASPQECVDTLSKFKGDWLLESSEVFEMDLPDATSGACPAGDVPIYRVWNARKDSNHRYTTTLAAQGQMIAKGYIPEGYGPNSVTLCALI
jgi:hypothetical protein